VSTNSESLPIYVRVLTRPKKARSKWEPNEEKPNDHLWLVFDTETTTDYRQDLRLGVARVYAFGNLTRTTLFHERVDDAERLTISDWATAHGFEVMSRDEFVESVFLPLALEQRAVVVGFNLPFDLSRLAASWSPSRKSGGAWRLNLVGKDDPGFAYTPGVRVEHIDARKSFVSFTGVKGRRLVYRGAFVDLKTLTAALTGEGHSLKSAGEALGCTHKKTEADLSGPVTGELLAYCLNDVDLTAELYEKAVARYREFNLPEHPSRVFSSASLGKAAFRARGVRPPSVEDSKILGRIMAAFYAGKVECRVVGREVPDVGVLDFTSQYPSLYCLLGAERYLTAERIKVRDSTEEVRVWTEELNVQDLLKPETWRDPRMWSLCEIDAEGEILPARSSYSKKAEPPTIGWNNISTEEDLTLPYLLPDILAAKLLGGKPPKIVRAVSFVSVGRQPLDPISILGTEVRPEDSLIQTLSEARILEKAKNGKSPREHGLKILVNAAAYGVFVEVNVKRHDGEMEVCGLDEIESFEESGAKVEEPGELFSPLLGATIASASHLLLALLDTVATKHGGEAVYSDTDSAFVTPSKVSPKVAKEFDALNPYSVPTDFLKDETPMHKGTISFFGLSSKRYCLFERGKRGRLRVLKASDHGLGMFQLPTNREKFVEHLWERLVRTVSGGEMSDGFAEFGYLPATAEFALTTPALLPRVVKVEGMRPFNFLTIRYLDPAALPEGADTLELLPFVSPKNPEWLALAEKDDTKTWAHVLRQVAEHRDRKYKIGSDGLILRRSVLVKKSSLVGLGKEGAKLAARLKLGKIAGGSPSVFIDWKRRLLAMGRAEARRLELPWRFVTRCKAKLRAGTLSTSGAAVRRLKRALLVG
jgi:hypothetical protein